MRHFPGDQATLRLCLRIVWTQLQDFIECLVQLTLFGEFGCLIEPVVGIGHMYRVVVGENEGYGTKGPCGESDVQHPRPSMFSVPLVCHNYTPCFPPLIISQRLIANFTIGDKQNHNRYPFKNHCEYMKFKYTIILMILLV